VVGCSEQHDANEDASENNDDASREFNDKVILGETLDVSLRDGTYSWSNPSAIPKDVIRPNRQSKRSSSTDVALNKNRYKRIPFDGCGSILLHQEPAELIEPNSPTSNATTKTASSRQRRKGRTGVTLWSASYVISYYMDAQWSKGGSWNRNENETSSRWTVLELGAGLGLCSAVASKHGMNVVSTDNDSAVLKLLKENLQRNQIQEDDGLLESEQSTFFGANRPSSQQQIHVHSLDWASVANDSKAEESHPVFVQLESLGGADLIVLSDVIYGATQPAWDALLTLLNKFCAQRRRIRLLVESNGNESDATKASNIPSGMVDPIVLLGYTQRRRDMSPQDEARFFAMLQAAGMNAELIPATSIPNGEKYMLTSLFQLRWIE